MQIVRLYDQLLAVAPTPVVALNRAVAVAEVHGPAAALTLLEDLELGDYYLFHAIRADLLVRLGRNTEAAAAYESAIGLTANASERAFLQRGLERARTKPLITRYPRSSPLFLRERQGVAATQAVARIRSKAPR